MDRSPSIYLDNNATTQLDPRVASAMHEVNLARHGNPSSQHWSGRHAKQTIEEARERILDCLGFRSTGMRSATLVFTSGGTEANNLALHGLYKNRGHTTADRSIIVSSIEHPSVLDFSASMNPICNVRVCPTLRSGVIDLESLESMLSERAYNRADGRGAPNSCNIVISLMSANNETGVIQPIDEASQIAKKWGAVIHTDAVQIVGKVDQNLAAWNVDAMTISAHKVFGPVGIGALILSPDVNLAPMLVGGSQQLGHRPGTEMVSLAVGFAEAIELATSELQMRSLQVLQLREALESKLLDNEFAPTIIGFDAANRLPNTVLLAYPGINRQQLQMALDVEGIACSPGSACASGSSRPSHVLQAMACQSDEINGAIRLSLSHENTRAEIDRVASVMQKIVSRLRTIASSGK